MKKFFNTAGPIKPELHYYIPSRLRLDWPELYNLIESQKYFILHAPRQTGKTSALLELMRELNSGGRYSAVYINIEGAQAARNDIEAGIATVCSVLVRSADVYLNDKHPEQWLYSSGSEISPQDRFASLLAYWAGISDKPIVLLIDEVDALIGDTLVSLLRQIRSGYGQRPDAFPQSVVLCGVRDIKDYRIHRSDGEIITGGSAFNIKSKSLAMGNFTLEEVKNLFSQHTEATGQKFSENIFDEIWEDTKGQPWLVNALGYEMTWEDREARDRNITITREKYYEARERLIISRATHLDQLSDKLKEPRVHAVISAILADNVDPEKLLKEISKDDQVYVEDLGLITTFPQIAISNRIYREVIPRDLTWVTQTRIVQELAWYQSEDKRIDMKKLFFGFQQFFRENSEIWIERFEYKEAGPQLLMQAFLQRLINGGGRLNREYGLGRRRTDLFIEWPLDEEKGFYGPVQRIIIELKIQRGTVESMLPQALKQTLEYADKCKADEAHLVIFNRDKSVSWDEKIWQRDESYEGRVVPVWGC